MTTPRTLLAMLPLTLALACGDKEDAGGPSGPTDDANDTDDTDDTDEEGGTDEDTGLGDTDGTDGTDTHEPVTLDPDQDALNQLEITGASQFFPGDVDGDGALDLLYSNASVNSGDDEVFLVHDFGGGATSPTASWMGSVVAAFILPDVNGDGVDEVLSGQGDDLRFAISVSPGTGEEPEWAVTVADANLHLEGRTDRVGNVWPVYGWDAGSVMVPSDGNHSYWTFDGVPPGDANYRTDLPHLYAAADTPIPGDLNGDGASDFATFVGATELPCGEADFSLAVLAGGAGTDTSWLDSLFVSGLEPITALCAEDISPSEMHDYAVQAVVGDVVGDDAPDLVAWLPSTEAVLVFEGPVPEQVTPTDADYRIQGEGVLPVGDVDGDGSLDFAVHRSEVNNNPTLAVFTRRDLPVDATGEDADLLIEDLGRTERLWMVDDVDGDGERDLLVWIRSSAVLFSNPL